MGWTQTMPIGIYYICFKKIRNPLGVAYYYGKCAWPLHAFATTFAVTACALNNFRGKDDGWNWAGAGFLLLPHETERPQVRARHLHAERRSLSVHTRKDPHDVLRGIYHSGRTY